MIRWEKGEHLPRARTMCLIAEATGTSARWLETGDDEEEDALSAFLADLYAVLERYARRVRVADTASSAPNPTKSLGTLLASGGV